MALPCRCRGTHSTDHRIRQEVTNPGDSRTSLESEAVAGNSPVGEITQDSLLVFPSSTGPVKSRVNLRGPPRKAKYYLATDSELVP